MINASDGSVQNHHNDGDRDLMVSWVHLRGAANAIVARAFARELRARLARHP